MPVTDTKKQLSVHEEAKARVFSREEEAVRQEREERRIRQDNEERRVQLVNEVRTAAQGALDEREELIPRFTQSLRETVELAVKLFATKQRYNAAASGAMRLKADLEVSWPRAFGRTPEERNLIADALMHIGRIGGLV